MSSGASLPCRVPQTATEVTKDWLAAALARNLGGTTGNVDKIEVLELEADKVQSGMLSATFR